jgi:peptidoglycan/LPS O-acetylase OafA/YrhL
MKQENPSSYLRALDGVRGLAILLVLLGHTEILHFGWTGVQLFFVLSGYLITNILLQEKEKPLPLKIKFRNFWMRRVLRIFPLYYLYLFCLLGLWLLFDGSGIFIRQLPWLLTYTYNFSSFPGSDIHYPVAHLWSLSVEEQFYLIYPFLVLLCSRRQLRPVVIILIIGAVCFRYFYGQHLLQAGYTNAGMSNSLTFSQIDAFLLGGSITIFNLRNWPARRIQFSILLILVTVIAMGLTVYLSIYHGPFSFNKYITHLGLTPEYMGLGNHVWSYLLLNVLFAALILLLAAPAKSWLEIYSQKLFSIQPLVEMGKISYGMYIIHLGILHIIMLLFQQTGIVTNKYLLCCIYLPVLYVAAKIIYELFEKSFLKLKEGFR